MTYKQTRELPHSCFRCLSLRRLRLLGCCVFRLALLGGERLVDARRFAAWQRLPPFLQTSCFRGAWRCRK